MVVKGFPLIKFQSRELIESLQNGLIYMNSLEWFRKHENDDGDVVVGDSFEAMLHINEGKFILPDTGEIIEIKDELIRTTSLNDYAYCMFGVNPYSKNFSFTSEQKKNIQSFGNTALLILDKDEFFNRLRAAALKEGYEIYGGLFIITMKHRILWIILHLYFLVCIMLLFGNEKSIIINKSLDF